MKVKPHSHRAEKYLLALGALSVLAMKPAKKGRVSFAGFQGFDFAHRGLHNLKEGIAENTLPAFQRAVEKEFGIELDVHLTKDGELVVFHDDDLVRAVSCCLKVGDCTARELMEKELFGTKEHMPLLWQVLNLVKGEVPLLIELKTDSDLRSSQYSRLCQRVMETLEGYKGTYCVESFDPRVLVWLRRKYPRVIRGQLMEHFRRHGSKVMPLYDFLARNLLFNFLTKPDFISYQYMDRDRLAFRLVKRLYGTQEFSWTVREPYLARFLKKEGSLVIFEGYENEEK